MANQVESSQPKCKRRAAALLPKLTEFYSFPDLPIELRFIIWKENCFDGPNPPNMLLPHSYHSEPRTPAILLVNKEARSEGLKWYQLSFGTNMDFSTLSYVLRPTIYINWQVDRLCFRGTYCFLNTIYCVDISFFDLCRRNGLQVLALNLQDFRNWTKFPRNPRTIMRAAAILRKFRSPQLESSAFRNMKKDGTMTKPKAAKVLFPKIIGEMEQIVSLWDMYEQDRQRLVNQLLDDDIIWDLNAELPPRLAIKLMRFHVPRTRRRSV
ncbi:hypothetical protein BDZ45DRAFT_755183 [Acephala macrosclerotiorum]|nr:hypothetical protein BDZ45DRAFT_755183 [Acephala macrosclerotiorum]